MYRLTPYVAPPIEVQSFETIAKLRDWSAFPQELLPVIFRLVHAAGDPSIADDLLFSPDALSAGLAAIEAGATIVTDVSMVQAGLKKKMLAEAGMEMWCGVHSEQAYALAKEAGITRSAAGMRLAREQFGDGCVLLIGDAPTAIFEALAQIGQGWRPRLVIGLPVGFIGTHESKAALWNCQEVPRITNKGTRGGSPWAASAFNGMLIIASQKGQA